MAYTHYWYYSVFCAVISAVLTIFVLTNENYIYINNYKIYYNNIRAILVPILAFTSFLSVYYFKKHYEIVMYQLEGEYRLMLNLKKNLGVKNGKNGKSHNFSKRERSDN